MAFGTIYASIVATGTLVWNIVRDRHDTGKLRISSNITCDFTRNKERKSESYSLGGDTFIPSLQDGERYFTIICTNTGKRPMTLVSWTAVSNKYYTNFNVTTPLSSSSTLKESYSFTFAIRDFDILRGRVSGISVEDTHGKLWNLPEAEFKKMKELMIEYRL